MTSIAGNIFLIGLPGSGKTSVGRVLARKINKCFFDADQYIVEKTGVDIPTIFDLEGELGFRLRESLAISQLAQKRNIVLATGGGAVLKANNRAVLKENGHIIYLHASPELLLERTQYDKNRPLLRVDQPLDKLKQLYQERDPIYRELADVLINVDGSSLNETVQMILTIQRSA